MVEHEHLVAQYREAIEIVGTFVVGDRRDCRLEARDVRLERDCHLVAKATLHPGAHGAEEPRRDGGDSKANGGQLNETGPLSEDSLAEEHQPQSQQRVGQRRELREDERRQHQPRLVPIPELAEPPHR